MKKLISLSIIVFLSGMLIQAQQDTMFIHQTGNVLLKVAVADIDSIVFYSSGVPGNTVTDIDGNVYTIVQIGSQHWLGQNLKVTHFNDGSEIPLELDSDAWCILTTPAYCWYNNDIANKNPYGALYNWYVLDETSNGGKNVCPEGWHVPSDDEWAALITYLGGPSQAGGKLKESGTAHWNSPNTGATNETGFTALPGGYRAGTNGAFVSKNEKGYWWSASENYASSGWYRNMNFNSAQVYRSHLGKVFGYAVRCIKDPE
jgi:uncharacterized protein (TIGR02145 family)